MSPSNRALRALATVPLLYLLGGLPLWVLLALVVTVGVRLIGVPGA